MKKKAVITLNNEDIAHLLKLLREENSDEAIAYLKKLDKEISRLTEPH